MLQILSEIKETIPKHLFSTAADNLVERVSSIDSAVDVLMPTCIYGLAIKSSSSSFLRVYKELSYKRNLDIQAKYDHFLSEKEVFYGDSRGLTKRLSQAVFGEKIEEIHFIISNHADVKEGTSAALMSLVCPAITNFLCKKIREENMDPAGLADFLSSNIPNIEKILPTKLQELLIPKALKTADIKPISKPCFFNFFSTFFNDRNN